MSDAGIAELFRRRWVPMSRLAYILIEDAEVAEEIVQDAFLQVHRRWGRLDNPDAYLRTAVVNGCRSHLRRRSVERRHPPVAPESVVQQTNEIGDAISHLPERQRIALALRFYCDLTDAEIARTISARPATVRSLIRRALIGLRKELHP